jgi:tetratricopeptide (TPR) repeat protein
LRGELSAAEEAYRAASQLGVEPQPGLALLRLAQGRSEQALSSLRRLVTAESDPLERLRFLPAYVEILLARSEHKEAESAVADLLAIAARFDVPMIAAIAVQARAELCLCAGEPEAALIDLRKAFQAWQEIAAPYMAARVRVALCRAYTALGDRDAAELECEAAHATFEKLGAVVDLRALAAFAGSRAGAPAHRLTARELHVPLHREGVADGESGLYFVGLPFQYSMSSGMIHGVGRDAARIVQIVAGRLSARSSAAPGGALWGAPSYSSKSKLPNTTASSITGAPVLETTLRRS